MSDPLKYPSATAADGTEIPNNQFCGTCGIYIPNSLGLPKNEFVPCQSEADSPLTCPEVVRAYCGTKWTNQDPGWISFVGEKKTRRRMAELEAWMDRLGIPAAVRDHWYTIDSDRIKAAAELQSAGYGDDDNLRGPQEWFPALTAWLHDGPDMGERLVALLRALVISPPATPDPIRPDGWTMGDIYAWHARLAKIAADVLGEVGDWEVDDD